MNANKAPKIQSISNNKDPNGQSQGSLAASEASSSRRSSLPKKNEAKYSIASTSNKGTSSSVSDGSRTLKTALSGRTVFYSTGARKSPTLSKASLPVKTEAKVSTVRSSITSRKTLNDSCRRLLCYFGSSNSKPSSPSEAISSKKEKGKSPSHSSVTVVMEKSVEVSCKDQRDSKDDSRTLTDGSSSMASPKLGAPRSTNREKQNLAGQSDISLKSNSTSSKEVQAEPVMKRQIQKTTGPEDPPVYNLRSRVQKADGSKDPPSCSSKSNIQRTEVSKDSPFGTQKGGTQRTEVSKGSPVDTQQEGTQRTEGPQKGGTYRTEGPQKEGTQRTEGPTASSGAIQKREIPKPDAPKDSPVSVPKRGIQKKEVQKTTGATSYEPPVKKIGTTKTSNPPLAIHDKNEQPSSSQHHLFYDPIHYIRWDGLLDKEREPSGQNCLICEQDLSCMPPGQQSDEYGYDNYIEDYYYEDDYDDGYDNALKYCLLPAVDILPCGHGFHSECLQYESAEEPSGDPQCIICLSMF